MMDSEGIAPLILNFGTTWRRTVSFRPSRFNPVERVHGVLVGRLHGRSGGFVKEINTVPVTGVETKYV